MERHSVRGYTAPSELPADTRRNVLVELLTVPSQEFPMDVMWGKDSWFSLTFGD